jgi:hypothetical protein
LKWKMGRLPEYILFCSRASDMRGKLSDLRAACRTDF